MILSALVQLRRYLLLHQQQLGLLNDESKEEIFGLVEDAGDYIRWLEDEVRGLSKRITALEDIAERDRK